MSEFERANCGINWSWLDAEYRYRQGRISQSEWEAFNALHVSGADGYAPPWCDDDVAELVVKIGDALEAAGRPLTYPARAVETLAWARTRVQEEQTA